MLMIKATQSFHAKLCKDYPVPKKDVEHLSIILTSITIPFIAARIYSRGVVMKELGMDDYAFLIASVRFNFKFCHIFLTLHPQLFSTSTLMLMFPSKSNPIFIGFSINLIYLQCHILGSANMYGTSSPLTTLLSKRFASLHGFIS
jgi:hypothetical protein